MNLWKPTKSITEKQLVLKLKKIDLEETKIKADGDLGIRGKALDILRVLFIVVFISLITTSVTDKVCHAIVAAKHKGNSEAIGEVRRLTGEVSKLARITTTLRNSVEATFTATVVHDTIAAVKNIKIDANKIEKAFFVWQKTRTPFVCIKDPEHGKLKLLDSTRMYCPECSLRLAIPRQVFRTIK